MDSKPPREDDGRVMARPDEQLLVLEGDVDLSAVEAFDRSRSDDLAWVRAIDVSAVSFVDTQGLGLMLRVAAPRGRDAPSERPALLGASPQVQQLLEMLGVESLFDLRPAADHGSVDQDGVDQDGVRPTA